MSSLPKNPAGTTTAMSTAEARARAALVEMESREPEAARNIKAIGRDPSEIPESVKDLNQADLYAPGKRPERRQVLLRHAVEYLFKIPIDDERGQDRVISRLGARTKLMVDWMINVWEVYLRPKTWMDALTPDKQARWAEAKRKYDRSIEKENLRLAKARAEYEKVVGEVQVAQAAAREELKSLLRDLGVKEAPLLTEKPEDAGIDKLASELQGLGINFRPPDPEIQ